MSEQICGHRLRVIGIVVGVADPCWLMARQVLDWGGRLDFVVAHSREPGRIGLMLTYLIAPPWWLPWLVLFGGLCAVYWSRPLSAHSGRGTTPAREKAEKPALRSPTAEPAYVPLWRIIEYVARVVGDKREDKYYAKTRTLIRQAALDRKLKIRGRHEIQSQNLTAFTQVHSDISPTYWSNSVINVLATAAETGTEYRHTDPETVYAWGPKGVYEENCYAQLRGNWDDVSHLW